MAWLPMTQFHFPIRPKRVLGFHDAYSILGVVDTLDRSTRERGIFDDRTTHL